MTPDDRFRQAAEAEDGQQVSAGARVGHVRAAVESGRGLYIDLSAVPSTERPELVARIRSFVDAVVALQRHEFMNLDAP